jgi:hypothetical protein
MITADANRQAACPQNVSAAVSLVHLMTIAGVSVGPFAFCSPGSTPRFMGAALPRGRMSKAADRASRDCSRVTS